MGLVALSQRCSIHLVQPDAAARRGYAVVSSSRVAAAAAGLRLDEAVQLAWPARFGSASAAKKACRRSLVLVDGVTGRCASMVAGGARLDLLQRVAAPASGEGRRGVAAAPLEVLHEDDSLAVVYKPAGLAVQGARGGAAENAGPTFRERLVGSIQPSRHLEGQPLWRPQHVHRLDAPTSGLVCVAKTGQALRALSAVWAARRVRKRYRAVVVGSAAGAPGGGAHSIELPLSGQEARTEWRRVSVHASDKYGEVSVVDLWPLSGRTHQLRRHMAAIGHPIVGDTKYWDRSLPAEGGHGLLLSAVELELAHPRTGAPLRVCVPQPRGFDEYCEAAA